MKNLYHCLIKKSNKKLTFAFIKPYWQNTNVIKVQNKHLLEIKLQFINVVLHNSKRHFK